MRSALFFRLALLLLAMATANADSTPNVEANGIMHGLPRALRTYIKPVPDTLFGWPLVVKKAAEEEKAVEAEEGEEEEEAEPVRVIVVVEPKEEEEAEKEEAQEEKEVDKKETNADVLKKSIAA